MTGAFAEYTAATDELVSEHGKDVNRFAELCFDVVLCGIDDALAKPGDLDVLIDQARRVTFDPPMKDYANQDYEIHYNVGNAGYYIRSWR